MKITTLIEDTAINSSIGFEHGLSQYIETAKHRLLFDTGKSGLLVDNAAVLGVDLKAVDTLVISHGHDDHWGGVMSFSEVNKTASIFINKMAVRDRWNKKKGVIHFDNRILELPHLNLMDGDYEIDDELFVFSSVTGNRCIFPGKPFYIMKDGEAIPDDFSHEQNLVINQDGSYYLFAGCAHKGIVNIMDRFREIFGKDPDYVFGGFHLYKKNEPYTDEETEFIRLLAIELSKRDTVYYTGHCTGTNAFGIMSKVLEDRLRSISSGDVFITN